ncbi:hypothetical protein C8R44DRAFT_786229 [Mycena epipterygia]|nr:hypothetical protein C8R44DRAFT_786229 [Mycena epipterygia]
MILVTVAEKQADALRAEITTLKETTAQAREFANNLSKERDLVQSNFDTKVREMAEAHARQYAELQGSTAREREALKVGQEALVAHRAAFEAEKAAAEKAMHNVRTSIVQNLRNIIQSIQLNPFPMGTGTTSLIAASGITGPCMPEPRMINPSDSTIPMCRSADQETVDESSPRKRARTESSTPTNSPSAINTVVPGMTRNESAAASTSQSIQTLPRIESSPAAAPTVMPTLVTTPRVSPMSPAPLRNGSSTAFTKAKHSTPQCGRPSGGPPQRGAHPSHHSSFRQSRRDQSWAPPQTSPGRPAPQHHSRR